MKYLFYLAHPAHFHLFKNTMRMLKEKGHTVIVTIKTKDVLRKLLEESGLPYINIAEKERKDSRTGIALSFLQRTFQHWKIVRKEKPDLFISTSAEFAPFARLLEVKSISVFEDDLGNISCLQQNLCALPSSSALSGFLLGSAMEQPSQNSKVQCQPRACLFKAGLFHTGQRKSQRVIRKAKIEYIHSFR
ncbi:MAG: hypothetical protein IPJ86_11465 [Bacteroidetes bacterium]|nr:hypothetical protein [Bacteroidota bacterium]